MVTTASAVTSRNYYPFGMSFDSNYGDDIKYLYNGKEIQEELGLDWYDYGARFFDPVIGRFHTMDPLAEKNHLYTPFSYASNNPTNYIDWMGLDTVHVNSNQPIKKDDVVVMENGNMITMSADEIVVTGEKKKDEEDQKIEAKSNEGAVKTAAEFILAGSLIEPTFLGEIAAGLYLSYLVIRYGPDIVEDIYYYFSKGSTKNERKSNPKAKASAENKVKEIEGQLKDAKTSSEKQELQRQLRHWQKKAHQKSEPHGRTSGRH